MAKVTHMRAAELYDASGRSWEMDAALPWLIACATEVATRVVRRVEAQRRARVGARATQPVEAVPVWLEEGVRRGRALAATLATGTSPVHHALGLIARVAPEELMASIGPDAELPDVLSALSTPQAAIEAARVVASEPRANTPARAFYEALRGVYLAHGRGEPTPRDVVLLAGAVGLDPFDGLDAARKRWEDRIRRWSRERNKGDAA